MKIEGQEQSFIVPYVGKELSFVTLVELSFETLQDFGIYGEELSFVTGG
jgi:hypothetical protein